MERQRVAVFRRDGIGYPGESPFHPAEEYPEYPYRGRGAVSSGNHVYEAVRQTFRLLDLDSARWGTPQWNPLGGWVRPGDRVLLKPNLVRHLNPLGHSIESLVTHGSVIRAMLDYVVIALRGEGSITVGDAPLQTCDFPRLVGELHLDEIVEHARSHSGLAVALRDFRKEQAVKDESGVVRARTSRGTDAGEHVAVRLDRDSHLAPVEARSDRFRVTNYDPVEMPLHHHAERHEYLVARPVLEADCLINLPKLKTHRKVGMTAALKNAVGINGSKDWLPHHTNGAARNGGDQYRERCLRKELLSRLLDRMEASPRYAARTLYGLAGRALWRSRRIWPFPDSYFEGSWYGNDTLWRTVLDLNRILFFADAQGVLHPDRPRRRYFVLVDGIVAGEGEGPVDPTPRPCGVLVAGDHPTPVDTCCAWMIGFDPSRLSLLRHAWEDPLLGYDPHWSLSSNYWADREALRKDHLDFRPPEGWKGFVRAEASARSIEEDRRAETAG